MINIGGKGRAPALYNNMLFSVVCWLVCWLDSECVGGLMNKFSAPMAAIEWCAPRGIEMALE